MENLRSYEIDGEGEDMQKGTYMISNEKKQPSLRSLFNLLNSLKKENLKLHYIIQQSKYFIIIPELVILMWINDIVDHIEENS